MQENNFCGDLFLCGMPWFDLNIFLGCVFQASCWKCLAIPAALAAAMELLSVTQFHGDFWSAFFELGREFGCMSRGDL